MDEKKYQVKIYDNERIIVSMHSYNPFKSRTEWNGHKRSKNYNEYMSKKDYFKTIRRWSEKIWKLNIDSNKCKFITLTLKEDMSWEVLLNKFTSFMYSIRRNFGNNTQYIRAVELQENSKRFHIHLVLVFEDNPPNISIKWIEDHWPYGYIHRENVNDVYGLMQYLTLFDTNALQSKSQGATHFPKNAKILSTSIKPSTAERIIEINESEYKYLRSYYDRLYYAEDGKYIKEDGHIYNDNGETKYCLDKVYIQASKEFVYNNYGTKEDDILFANNEELKKFAKIKEDMKSDNVF